jgi:hypothetical protein
MKTENQIMERITSLEQYKEKAPSKSQKEALQSRINELELVLRDDLDYYEHLVW